MSAFVLHFLYLWLHTHIFLIRDTQNQKNWYEWEHKRTGWDTRGGRNGYKKRKRQRAFSLSGGNSSHRLQQQVSVNLVDSNSKTLNAAVLHWGQTVHLTQTGWSVRLLQKHHCGCVILLKDNLSKKKYIYISRVYFLIWFSSQATEKLLLTGIVITWLRSDQRPWLNWDSHKLFKYLFKWNKSTIAEKQKKARKLFQQMFSHSPTAIPTGKKELLCNRQNGAVSIYW